MLCYDKMIKFDKELTTLLNKYSVDNDTNTPDFILSRYLLDCLFGFGIALNLREEHSNGKKNKVSAEYGV